MLHRELPQRAPLFYVRRELDPGKGEGNGWLS
jgi:hypothetical protein